MCFAFREVEKVKDRKKGKREKEEFECDLQNVEGVSKKCGDCIWPECSFYTVH